MPIKASYADAFYRACANDYFCDSGSFWTCHAEYHAHLAELAANKTKAEEEEAAKLKLELEAEKKKTKAEEEEAAKLKLELEAEKKNKDKGLPAWAIALIVVLSLLGNPRPLFPARQAALPSRAALPRRPADSSPPVRQACSAAPSSWCSSSRRSRASRCSSPWRTTRTSR